MTNCLMSACRRAGAVGALLLNSSRQSLIWQSTGAYVRWTAATQHLTSVAGGTSLIHAGECRAQCYSVRRLCVVDTYVALIANAVSCQV